MLACLIVNSIRIFFEIKNKCKKETDLQLNNEKCLNVLDRQHNWDE
jgi:hypothetical protein